VSTRQFVDPSAINTFARSTTVWIGLGLGLGIPKSTSSPIGGSAWSAIKVFF
jgi:hypothetical protein